MSDANFDLDRLKYLLAKRNDYFLLDVRLKKEYLHHFEKIQKEIIIIKLKLEIYQDELDLFSISFSYIDNESNQKLIAIEEASRNKEIRWLKKKYNPLSGLAEYIGQISPTGIISNLWLQEKYLEHMMKREGFLECPWPTKIN